MENTGRNLFKPLSQVWLSFADFHEFIITQKSSMGSSWAEFYPDRVKNLAKLYLRP